VSGELPPGLSRCSSLRTVILRSNGFHGDLNSVDFSSLHRLKVLDFMDNNFTGTVPERIDRLKSLRFLSLTNNSFTNVTNAL
jgi:Leucine-rich repeat (LRR) protein